MVSLCPVCRHPNIFGAGLGMGSDEPPLHAPHGLYSVIMEWVGDGKPIEPPHHQQREYNGERATG